MLKFYPTQSNALDTLDVSTVSCRQHKRKEVFSECTALEPIRS